MMIFATTTLACVIFWQTVLGDEGTRWCYECGTGVVGEPDCLEFATAGSWTPFWRKCPGDNICVKTVAGWNTSDESRAVRGCTPLRNLQGYTHKDGCGTHHTSSMLICYCSTDLCNTAHTPIPPTVFVIIAALVIMAVGG